MIRERHLACESKGSAPSRRAMRSLLQEEKENLAMPVLEALEPRLLLSGSLLITEFMADNDGGLADFEGDFEDWIELQNTSDSPLNLLDWKLKDTNRTWAFPDKTLAPGEFIVVFASNKNLTNPAGELHTNFALSKDGELLRLIRPDGGIEQEFNPFPEQFENVSYGISQTQEVLLDVAAPFAYHVPTSGDAALGTTWTLPAFDDSSFQTTVSVPTSTVLLTEIATGTPDYIEFQNVSSQTVNTSGWVIAAGDTTANINAVNSVIEPLPAQLTAGQVFYLSDATDEPAANRWDNNLNWGNTANGWVMLLNQAGTVVDFVVWGFSAAQVASLNVNVNGFNITAANLPWTGGSASVAGATNTGNSLKRTGSVDHNNASDWAMSAPQTKGAANAGLVTPFPDGSSPALTGVGYATGDSASGFDVSFIKANVQVGSLAAAETVIVTPAQQTQVFTGKFDVINFQGTTSDAHYSNNNAFPGNVIGTNVDDYISLSTTKIYLPHAGKWTFGVNSDDGFGLDVFGQGASLHIEFAGVRGPGDTLGVFDAPVAGIYDLRLVQFDRTGGSHLELFAADGEFTAFSDAAFRLVGDTANNGIAAAGFGADIRADIEAELKGVNASLWTRFEFNVADPTQYDALTLKMKYDAGFVAYLNGVEVARRNAPASLPFNAAATLERTNSDAAFFESINISSFLSELVTGNNVLAIHGLNSSAGDADFFLLPTLTAGSTEGTLNYFSSPTPGATNAQGIIAFVQDTQFSIDRGFYNDPFQLAITTPTAGATIRYTTNGSTPTTTNGTIYTGPITISQTTVVRAIAYKTGHQATNVDTHSYFFVADILQQSPTGTAPAGWPSGTVNGQVFNYGMDPDIVNDPVWGPQLASALTAIPTMSIVTDLAHLLDPVTGIYVNALEDSIVWERPTSLELIDPMGLEEGFQIDAGIRIRGGFSRNDGNPKHSFRFFFRSEYGESKLEYALFGDEGVDVFDKIDLRTSQNYSWAFGGDARNIMNRDVFSRDTQADLGDQYTRSRYYHLYIDGVYWGLYQTQERAEADFASQYFGGEPEDYDVVKVEAGPYTINATDGNLDAWNALWNLANQGFETQAKYNAVQGLNPDGTRNTSLPVYLDIDNLINYMLIVFYGGNLDAPISNFLSNNSPNNWYGIYNHTTQDQGFQFFEHDSEHTLLTANLNVDRNGPWPAGDTFEKSNPQWIHQQLMFNDEYRLRFADLIQKHFFNDGAMTAENNTERFLDRASEIELAIIAESARWGDSKVATPFTKTHWQNEINNIVNNYFTQRGAIALNQFRNTTLRTGALARLFPSIDAPSFNVHGGIVGPAFPLAITAPSGVIYYTLDGSDPRLLGGGINPNALMFDASTSSQSLLTSGSSWKYLDNGSDQGTAWRHAAYDDSSWQSGNGPLGYGDGDEATVVNFGPDVNNKYITTYFRSSFNVADVDKITSLILRLVYDDGAVVFINGQPAISPNMASSDVSHTTPALSTRGVPDESAFVDFAIDPALLIQGVNTIAVEIHQSVPNSSDLSFDLELLAQVFNDDPVSLTESGSVRTRALLNNEWSALNEAVFLVNTPPTPANLAITELNYHPAPASTAELLVDPMLNPNEFEYLELMNIGSETIDLFGVRFIEGITFDFTDSMVSALAPGERVLIVSNLTAFELRYGAGLNVAGEYDGQLANGGELLTAIDSHDDVLISFTFSDSGSWPGRADGEGSSLEVIDPFASPLDYNDPNTWRSSSEVNGSPGAAGMGPDNRVLINEVLSHTDLPLKDTIELVNTTTGAIDISGWFISDSTSNLSKFRIPNGTILTAAGTPGSYIVFDEDDFNPGLGTQPNDFSFNAAHGDNAYLVEADVATLVLERFVDAVSFGAQANGESWGRYPNAAGGLTPMLSRTLGASGGTNSGPRIGPVIISEIMYHPPVPAGGLPADVTIDDLEFIEIHNPTDQAIDLLEWRLRGGIDFDFSPAPGNGSTLAAGATLVILSFNPTNPLNSDKLSTFRSVYGIDASVPLLGGYSGMLDNVGEKVRLERADEPPTDEPGFYPHLLEDEVDYLPTSPWPTSAAGTGDSLHRLLSAPPSPGFGAEFSSFTSGAPTPGSVNAGSDILAPTVTAILLSGTSWLSAFFTFLKDNALGDDGFALQTGANQLIPLPWTNANQIMIVFSEHVIVTQDDLHLRGVNTTELPIAAFSYDPTTFTATWTFDGHLNIDKWLIDLSDTIEDAAGLALDGEWTDGVSAFHAGDGTAGGDLLFRFNTLPGDVDGDADVDPADVNAVRSNQFKTTTTGGYSYRQDVNAGGSIFSEDVIAVRNRQFTLLPVGQPTAAPSGAGLIAGQGDGEGASVGTSSAAQVSQSIAPVTAASLIIHAIDVIESRTLAAAAAWWHEQQRADSAPQRTSAGPRSLENLESLWSFNLAGAVTKRWDAIGGTHRKLLDSPRRRWSEWLGRGEE